MKTLRQRLYSSIVIRSDGCWLWAGALFKNGYGRIRVAPKRALAHRVSWEIHKGEIPADSLVLHKCDVRACVNPDHLFLGSAADNVADMVNKGRQRKGPVLHQEYARGEMFARSELTETHVREIRERQGENSDLVAAAYGVHRATVHDIWKRRTWKHVT